MVTYYNLELLELVWALPTGVLHGLVFLKAPFTVRAFRALWVSEIVAGSVNRSGRGLLGDVIQCS